MKHWILICVISSILYVCHGATTPMAPTTKAEKSKNELTKEIIRKICHIALGPLRDANEKQKHKLFEKLENKVRAASKVLKTDNENYIKIIMQGVQLMSTKGDYRLCAQVVPNMRAKLHKRHQIEKSSLRSRKPNDYQNATKIEIIRSMLSKLQVLAEKYFKNASTPEQKERILEKIKLRVSEALRRRHIIDGKNDTYSSIIMQGLKLMMQKKDNDSRRMTLELLTNPKALLRANVENMEPTTTPAPPMGLTTPLNCEVEYKKICKSLEGLSQVICKYDDTTLSLDKLCDGNIDCPDGSDEKNCARQAVVKVHAASQISTIIDSARQCFTSVTEDNLFAQQGKMLQELLQSQINFIKKYRDENNKNNENAKTVQLDDQSVAELSNEVFSVIKTFEITLTGAFCFNPDVTDMDNIMKRYGTIDAGEAEDVLKPPKWNFKVCGCTGKICSNATCPMYCKRICYQRYSLKRLTCQSINNENSVSLDVVCDGKFDCFDEADEHDCSMTANTRFEAQNIFETIKKLIQSKLKSLEFRSAQNRLASLYEAIKVVETRSIKSHKVQNNLFKIIRDKCFGLMVAVYDDSLDTIQGMPNAEMVYSFLESLKDMFILALKKSQTGNTRVIAPDGCFCKDAMCATHRCSKKCARTCAAKPFFTKYSCKSSVGNNLSSIPIEAICNGKPNCPGGEDELNCKKDICRPHHLVVLRHHLKSVGDKHKGTVLGEVLNSWKTKVLSNILIAEKRERPTPRTFKELISEILGDLVTSYASLEEYRRTNNEGVLRKFEKLAQRIMETSKSCGQ